MNKLGSWLSYIGLVVGLLGTLWAAYYGSLELSTQLLKTGAVACLMGELVRGLPTLKKEKIK